MITLNVLPPQEKKILALEKAQRWIIFYGCNILGILIIAIALLGIIWFSINIELNGVAANLAQIQFGLKGQDLKAQQGLVNTLNADLKTISNLQKNQKNYSHLLISLADLVPDGIRITNLSFNEKNAASLSGHAQRREQIIAFQEALEKSNLFENIKNPLENLVKQTDIDFNFSFTIKNGALNQ